jgi:hypothetical protein
VYRNPQHRSLLTAVSATCVPSWASSATFEHPWENFWTNYEPLYVKNTSHSKQETFLYEYPLHWVLLPTRNAQQNATILTTESSLWTCTCTSCYLDCHAAGLCCYLSICIENLLHIL